MVKTDPYRSLWRLSLGLVKVRIFYYLRLFIGVALGVSEKISLYK